VRGRVIKWERHREVSNSFNGLVEDQSKNWFSFKTFELLRAGYVNEDVRIGDLVEFDEGPQRTGPRGRQVRCAINLEICTKR